MKRLSETLARDVVAANASEGPIDPGYGKGMSVAYCGRGVFEDPAL